MYRYKNDCLSHNLRYGVTRTETANSTLYLILYSYLIILSHEAAGLHSDRVPVRPLGIAEVADGDGVPEAVQSGRMVTVHGEYLLP